MAVVPFMAMVPKRQTGNKDITCCGLIVSHWAPEMLDFFRNHHVEWVTK